MIIASFLGPRDESGRPSKESKTHFEAILTRSLTQLWTAALTGRSKIIRRKDWHGHADEGKKEVIFGNGVDTRPEPAIYIQ